MNDSTQEDRVYASIVSAAQAETSAGLPPEGVARVLAALRQELPTVDRLPQRSLASAQRPLWWWGLGFATATAALVLVLVWVRTTAEPSDRSGADIQVVFQSGQVEFAPGAIPPTPASFAAGSKFRVAGRSRLDFEVPGKARVAVIGPAQVQVVQASLVRLEDGSASFSVSPHPPEAPFRVLAGEAEVVVVGTEFSLDVLSGQLEELQVASGVVEVRLPGSVQRVAAGGSYRRLARMENSESSLLRPFEAAWWKRDVPAGATEPPEAGKSQRIVALWGQARSLLSEGRCDELEQTGHRLRALETKSETPRVDVLSGECRLRHADRQGALRIFREVAERYLGTQAAESALYEVARLEGELGMMPRSLLSLESYLRRYPEGQYKEIAEVRRCEALIALGNLSPAQKCLEDYRSRYTQGMRARQAGLSLASLHQSQGGWAEAARLYQEVLAGSPTHLPEVEDILYRLADCQRLAGSPAFPDTVNRYLERFPNGPHAKEFKGWRNKPTHPIR